MTAQLTTFLPRNRHGQQFELEPMMPDSVYQESRDSILVEIEAQESSRPYVMENSDKHDSMMTGTEDKESMRANVTESIGEHDSMTLKTDTKDEESSDNTESSDGSDSEDASLPWSFLNK